MRAECEELQIKIITLGAKAALSDPAVKRHLESCPLCEEFLRSAADLEHTESELTEHDVPEDVFARTVSEVKKAQAAVLKERGELKKGRGFLSFLFHPILGPAVAMALCGVVVLTLSLRTEIGIRKERSEIRSQVAVAGAGSSQLQKSAPIAEIEKEAPPVLRDEKREEEKRKDLVREERGAEAGKMNDALEAAPEQETLEKLKGAREGQAVRLRGHAADEVIAPAPRRMMEADAASAPQNQFAQSAPSATGQLKQQGSTNEEPALGAAKETAQKPKKRDWAADDAYELTSSKEEAAKAVEEGRFEDAWRIVQTLFPVAVVENRKVVSKGETKERIEIHKALADIQIPGHDTPEARAALKKLILGIP